MIHTLKELIHLDYGRAQDLFAWANRPDREDLLGLSDTQMDWVVICVGARRCSFWDGIELRYNEQRAFRYPTKELATTHLQLIERAKRQSSPSWMPGIRLQLFMQPKQELGHEPYWPTFMGYTDLEPTTNELGIDSLVLPEVGTKIRDGERDLSVKAVLNSQAIELSDGRILILDRERGLCLPS